MTTSWAKLAIIGSIVLVSIIDITVIMGGASPLAARFATIESAVDIILIVAAYLVLNREIRARREANEIKTKFMNMAAHDLRNPLAIIKGYSDLLLDEPDLDLKHHEMVARIGRQTNTMLALIDDILKASRVEQKGLEIEPTVNVDLNRVAEEVISDFRPTAEAKDQRIYVRQTGAGQTRVNVAPRRIKQVIGNLLSNALKYSSPGAPIHVDIDQVGDHVQLRITDQGPGLSNSEIETVFEPFTKVKKRTTAGEPSTGLGLSIAKTIVEQHGGKIWAQSDGPGRGSRFVFDLPRQSSPDGPSC